MKSRGDLRAAVTALLESAKLPTSDLTDEHVEQFFFLGPPATPFAAIGLELHGKNALLRSLVVAREKRSRPENMRDLSPDDRGRRVFAKFGYARIGRSEAPESIRSTREFSEICPVTSALMVKHL